MSKLKRVEHSLFFLLILILPTQLGIHFWPDWSSVFGIRVDYLSPTIYLTDILVVALLISWLLSRQKHSRTKELKNKKFINLVFCFFVFLFFSSLLVAQNQGAALYKLVKLVEFSLLGFYVFKNYTKYSILNTLYFPLSAALVYSSLLAWYQFLAGHTLGLWLLGERTFDINTPGIALQSINGVDYLRPYATFPHPNVLAGFLLVGILLLKLPSYTATQLPSKFSSVAWLLGLSTLILTFSHSAWVAGLAALFVYGIPKLVHLASKYFIHITLFAILVSLLFPFLTGGINTDALPQEFGRRIDLGRAAMGMVVDNHLFGVGLGNFVVRLPEYGGAPSVSWFLQPVHNIFLLVLAETGLVGFGFFLWVLSVVFKRLRTTNYVLLTTFLVILITGTTDHYWLTLQQGQLMLAIVFGAGIGKMK